mmetsp:Transcript_22114/g.41464  ORF Transcript_22114/g.41464 Transcript_22114/m.41464 type:complete len:255 (-) Transcript_22114:187-951(-)
MHQWIYYSFVAYFVLPWTSEEANRLSEHHHVVKAIPNKQSCADEGNDEQHAPELGIDSSEPASSFATNSSVVSVLERHVSVLSQLVSGHQEEHDSVLKSKLGLRVAVGEPERREVVRLLGLIGHVVYQVACHEHENGGRDIEEVPGSEEDDLVLGHLRDHQVDEHASEGKQSEGAIELVREIAVMSRPGRNVRDKDIKEESDGEAQHCRGPLVVEVKANASGEDSNRDGLECEHPLRSGAFSCLLTRMASDLHL